MSLFGDAAVCNFPADEQVEVEGVGADGNTVKVGNGLTVVVRAHCVRLYQLYLLHFPVQCRPTFYVSPVYTVRMYKQCKHWPFFRFLLLEVALPRRYVCVIAGVGVYSLDQSH